MKATETIEKYFVLNIEQPKDVKISDHFAMGCYMLLAGEKAAGEKLLHDALLMAGCNSSSARGPVVNLAKKDPRATSKLVYPHEQIDSAITRLKD